MDNYLIIIEKNKNNFSAYSPDVPGCVATGKTEKEVKKNMDEALAFHIEGLKEEGYKVPTPKTNFYFVDNEIFNGVINVRCTKSLQKKLYMLSKKENVSISHLVNDALVKAYV